MAPPARVRDSVCAPLANFRTNARNVRKVGAKVERKRLGPLGAKCQRRRRGVLGIFNQSACSCANAKRPETKNQIIHFRELAGEYASCSQAEKIPL